MTESDQSFIGLVQQSRYAAAAVALALLWIAESVAPMFVGRERRVSHIASNFGLAAINALVASTFAVSILGVTEWTSVHQFGLLNWIPMPTWAKWVAAIVL